MSTRRRRFVARTAARVGADSPFCANPRCRHHKLRHGTTMAEDYVCLGNTVWPHINPFTGQAVPYSHCDCQGFVAESTVEE